MQLNPILNFNGKCEEAFKFYQKCLGGTIQTMMTWGESPMADHVPAEWRNKIIHTTLVVGDTVLMGGDSPSDRYEKPAGFSIAINLDDTAVAERVFKDLADNGSVTMPLQKTFWAKLVGMAVDRFGIPWMVNCGVAEQSVRTQSQSR